MRTKSIFRFISLFLLFGVVFSVVSPVVFAQEKPPAGYPLITPFVTPRPCISNDVQPDGSCPSSSRSESFCPGLTGTDQNNYPCANTYEEWLTDTTKNFWVYDPEVTSLGKGGERSRQFLLWVLTHPSIDDHPVIMDVWKLSRSVALFLILMVVIILGVGIIIGQRNDFSLSIEITPLIIRVGILILFVVLSARIVLLFVEIADIMMEFFIRNLKVKDLFNIYFVKNLEGDVIRESETAYRCFVGCSNWNTNNLEMMRTSSFLVKITNMTYYFLGVMLILRKIVLWFLLIVAPFLAILAPFILIRNTGWIWIGVFFQWVFYGPLFALFLGTLASIWGSAVHIPFIFDFSRVQQFGEVVYPTSINILYGGPAQELGVWNTSNYVDTFAEYVIALLMLWTVIILPWWLLRIFRDYCCDGINAMKNIMMSAIGTSPRGGGPGPFGPAPTPRPAGTTGRAMDLPTQKSKRTAMPTESRMSEEKYIEREITIKNVEEIKKARTDEIVRSVNMSASTLTDVARFDSSKVHRETVMTHMQNLQNPMRAKTPTERQKYMAIRNEIMERANKGDTTAQKMLSVISQSKIQSRVEKDRILKTIPKMVPIIKTIAIKVQLPEDKTKSIVKSILNEVTRNETVVNKISTEVKIPAEKTREIIRAISSDVHMSQPASDVVTQVAKETNVEPEKVRAVVSSTAVVVKQNEQVSQSVAQKEQVDEQTVEKVAQSHLPTVVAPDKHIEEQVPVEKVSIEEYEQVKDMWTDQYERGEVPVSEDIKDRETWVNKDVVTITNMLNKIASSDPVMQSEGLDQVGEILPVFMVNSMSGEELTTYLRAKLEAAKDVAKISEKEKEAVKREGEEEELVEVRTQRVKTEAKQKHMQAELTIDGGDNSNSNVGSGMGGEQKIDLGYGGDIKTSENELVSGVEQHEAEKGYVNEQSASEPESEQVEELSKNEDRKEESEQQEDLVEKKGSDETEKHLEPIAKKLDDLSKGAGG